VARKKHNPGCPCCDEASSSSPSSSSLSSSSSSSSSSRNLLDCWFCQYQGPFAYIRLVFEVSGWPAVLTLPGNTITGLNGRNGTYIVEIPIVDGCPEGDFQTDPDNENLFGPSAYAEGDRGGLFTVSWSGGSRDENWFALALTIYGKLYSDANFELSNQTGSAIPSIPGVSTREPVNAIGNAIELCEEILSGYEHTFALDDTDDIITTVGYVEIGLI
jgi:hypothetical protein